MIKHKTSHPWIKILSAMLCLWWIMLSGCGTSNESRDPTPLPTTSPTTSATISPSATATKLPTLSPPTPTRTIGPSPTSTPQLPLAPFSWQAAPLMIEAAFVDPDAQDLFQYIPFFLLYGDGLLVKRSCQDGECRYLQDHLEQDALCRLANAIERTGFLNADPLSVNLPGGTGREIRLNVTLFSSNHVQIPDLDRWSESTDWFADIAGCVNCFQPPEIEPAFLDLFRLLITYPDAGMRGLPPQRLALWISEPVIAGTPQTWPEDLIPLSTLVERSACNGAPSQQGVIIEGNEAFKLADFLSSLGNSASIFAQNNAIWQVQSRWLLPHEMPKTCQNPAGMVPPESILATEWMCDPSFGAIPTPTATITPTPSNTPTPIR